jgi:hypothetical protein
VGDAAILGPVPVCYSAVLGPLPISVATISRLEMSLAVRPTTSSAISAFNSACCFFNSPAMPGDRSGQCRRSNGVTQLLSFFFRSRGSGSDPTGRNCKCDRECAYLRLDGQGRDHGARGSMSWLTSQDAERFGIAHEMREAKPAPMPSATPSAPAPTATPPPTSAPVPTTAPTTATPAPASKPIANTTWTFTIFAVRQGTSYKIYQHDFASQAECQKFRPRARAILLEKLPATSQVATCKPKGV